VLVVAGAELLLDGLLAVAARLRIRAFVAAVVFSGFELENIVAGIAANAKGLGGAAAGTFLGGTTFLALGVAGLSGLIAPIRADVSSRALVSAAAAPVPLLLLTIDGDLGRLDGAVLLAWFLIVIVAVARAGGAAPPEQPRRRRAAALRLAAGLGLLTAGGELLGDGLRRVVARFDVSQTLLGNTAIAASVEAEEVARVAVAGRRGRSDVALGNLLGTIVHFISFNAAVIALVKPLSLDHATRLLHLPAAAAGTWTLCALAAARGRIGRPEGALLVGLYAAYVAAAVLLGV
jgi:cation:H+ antiporter